jgi:hypothetical protein
MWATFAIFKELPRVSNHPLGVNSPYLVILKMGLKHGKRCVNVCALKLGLLHMHTYESSCEYLDILPIVKKEHFSTARTVVLARPKTLKCDLQIGFENVN